MLKLVFGIVTYLVYEAGFNTDGGIVWEDKSLDSNVDQVVDLQEYLTYDANGYRTSYESLDGEGNLLEFANYSWREDGQPLSMSSDNDGDGLLNWSEVYEYNESGSLSRALGDVDGDEIYDLSYTYNYNEDGNLMSEDKTQLEDEFIFETWNYSFSCGE